LYSEGISKVGGILDLAVENGLVDKRGSFFSYGETRIGQGRDNAKGYLREHPELMAELDGRIRSMSGLSLTSTDQEGSEAAGTSAIAEAEVAYAA
ncbi:MAG: DNA recombination/repair protein RecA, partial [Chloroflexota bacterium]